MLIYADAQSALMKIHSLFMLLLDFYYLPVLPKIAKDFIDFSSMTSGVNKWRCAMNN